MQYSRNLFFTALQGFSRFFFRHPLIGFLILVAVAFLSVTQVRNIKRDGSIEGFFQADSAEIAEFSAFKRQFGQDGLVVVAVSSDNLFAAHTLRKLARFHQALVKQVPYLEDITSLYNVRSVIGGDQLFVVNDLLAHFLRQGNMSEEALATLRQKVLAHPIYRNLVISPDGEMTLILLRPDRFMPIASKALENGDLDVFKQFLNPDQSAEQSQFLGQRQLAEIVHATAEVASEFGDADFRISMAGSPVASSEIVRILSSDMPRFTQTSLLVTLGAVFLMTRRFSAVISLFMVIVSSGLGTLGIMAATGTAIKPPTQILPSIVIVVSACTVLHLIMALARAYSDVKEQGSASVKERALELALRRTALPIVFTAATTVAGMLAFSGSPLAPVSDLGIFGAVAVVLALALAFSVVPIAFRIFSFEPVSGNGADGWLLARAKQVSVGAARHWQATLLVTTLLTLLVALGLFGLRFYHNSLEWLPPDNQVRQDTLAVDSKMKGTINLEVVVSTGRPYGIQSEQLIKTLDALAEDIPNIAKRHGFTVGKVFGVTDLLKEVNQALVLGKPNGYRLPEGDLIGREFFLFENSASNDLPDFVDSHYTKTRFTIRVPWLEASVYTAFIDDLRATLETNLAPLGIADPVITGNMALLAQTSVNVIKSMAWSYGLSLVLIWLLMAFAMRQLSLGFVSMIPNILPIAATLGFMGYVGIPLDSFTMLIGCIALGLLVDDTIHFFHHIRNAQARGEGPEAAVKYAVHHSFLPILSTSVAIMLGFAPFAYSSMSNVVAFGLLVALAAFLGLVAELVLSPALVGALGRHKAELPPVGVETTTVAAGHTQLNRTNT